MGTAQDARALMGQNDHRLAGVSSCICISLIFEMNVKLFSLRVLLKICCFDLSNYTYNNSEIRHVRILIIRE